MNIFKNPKENHCDQNQIRKHEALDFSFYLQKLYKIKNVSYIVTLNNILMQLFFNLHFDWLIHFCLRQLNDH